MAGFSIHDRNPGHWDVVAKSKFVKPGLQWPQEERAFCIRGEPGDVQVRDERYNPAFPTGGNPRRIKSFKSIQAALLYIADELMVQEEF